MRTADEIINPSQRRRWIAAACFLAPALLVACSGGGTDRSALVDVPWPDVSAMEPLVRAQLETGRATLQRRLGDADVSDPELAATFGETGMLHQAYGLGRTALACYRNARTLDDADFRWPYYLGQLYGGADDYQNAVSSFGRALEIQPDNTVALIHLGRVEFDRGEYERAQQWFAQARQLEPSSAPALTGLGKIALASREYASAVELLGAALAAEPRANEARYPLGLAYRGLGNEDRALEYLSQTGAVQVTNLPDPLMQDVSDLVRGWRVYLNRGTTLFQAGQFDTALAEFRKAVEAKPDEPLLHANLGSTLVQLGDHDGAVREFEEAVRLDPGAVTANFNLGTLAARVGDDDGAIRYYEVALGTNPNQLSAHLNLANSLRRVGRFEEALEHYAAVVEGDPSNAQARLGGALSLLRLHRHAEALAGLEEAHKAIPEHRGVRNALARLLATAPRKSLRDGARAMQLAADLFNENPDVRFVITLAMAAAENRNFEMAQSWQRQALDVIRENNRNDLLEEVERNYQRYLRGEPCRRAWADDDPILSPRALTSGGTLARGA